MIKTAYSTDFVEFSPLEIEAVARVFADKRTQPLLIGSVSGNIIYSTERGKFS